MAENMQHHDHDHDHDHGDGAREILVESITPLGDSAGALGKDNQP